MFNNTVCLSLCGLLLGFPSKKTTRREARTHSRASPVTQKMTALPPGMKMARFACGECLNNMTLKHIHSHPGFLIILNNTLVETSAAHLCCMYFPNSCSSELHSLSMMGKQTLSLPTLNLPVTIFPWLLHHFVLCSVCFMRCMNVEPFFFFTSLFILSGETSTTRRSTHTPPCTGTTVLSAHCASPQKVRTRHYLFYDFFLFLHLFQTRLFLSIKRDSNLEILTCLKFLFCARMTKLAQDLFCFKGTVHPKIINTYFPSYLSCYLSI